MYIYLCIHSHTCTYHYIYTPYTHHNTHTHTCHIYYTSHHTHIHVYVCILTRLYTTIYTHHINTTIHTHAHMPHILHFTCTCMYTYVDIPARIHTHTFHTPHHTHTQMPYDTHLPCVWHDAFTYVTWLIAPPSSSICLQHNVKVLNERGRGWEFTGQWLCFRAWGIDIKA